MESPTSRKWLIGVGVGIISMVVFTGLMFLLLIFRRRYLQRDDKYLKRIELANHSRGIDMTRTVAWSHRNGFRPEGGGPALADSPYDPTLRPLHGRNDPFFHRERQAQYGYSQSGSTPRDSYSDRSGNIAIVPFRESNLPTADASYDIDGRIRAPDGYAQGGVGGGGRREEFPGSRPNRTRRNPVESSLGFDDELFDLAAGRRPNRDVPHWRRDSNNPWVENTRHSSSPETSTDYGRRGAPTGNNINFSRNHRNPDRRLPRIHEPRRGHHWDSSHLQEVYY